GRIGAATAKIYAGFGATITAYDAYPNKDLDFLTYKESYHLFDKAMFDHVKKGAILVNAARGAVINTPDLIAAVNDGTLLGAAIDTYENEAAYFTNDWTNKDIDDKTLLELIEHERILVTPHIAFFSDEAVQNLVEGGLNAALSVINTGTCETRLN
ncbi:lactate dehydrogenase, partial [Staphylococcus aureus]|nr:lactate dehydrogenase [Staphylococcus aureus]